VVSDSLNICSKVWTFTEGRFWPEAEWAASRRDDTDRSQARSAWDWSLAVKELGKSVKYSGMKLWLGFLRVVVQGEVGPEVGKTFWSYRVVP
jgi:hypothetical protein